MNQLAKKNSILYVDPQESLTYKTRWWGRRRASAGRSPIPEGLQLVHPWSVLPFGKHWSIAHRVNMALLSRQVHLCRDLLPPDIWWVYDPAAVPIVEQVKGRLVIYDCVDRHSAYGGYRGLLDRLESRLLRRADLVFVTARGLLDHCRACTNEVHFMPNGYDEALFSRPVPVPTALQEIPRPRLGFVGGLGHWLDMELLSAVAKARPEWSFVLVGPVGDRTALLPNAPNIHLLGRCSREEVPGYIAGFDAGLVPFRETTLTRTVNPLKAYEYLAAGVPVVSTPMPELDEVEMVRQSHGVDGFISAIEEALAEGRDTDWIQRRKAAVAPFSQQRILKKMSTLIEEKLGG